MSRLIDADALEAKWFDWKAVDSCGTECAVCAYRHDGENGTEYCEIIHNMPTIDPVKHAKWIKIAAVLHHNNKPCVITYQYMCSNCNYEMPVASDLQNYCCNCGAKMDLNNENNNNA